MEPPASSGKIEGRNNGICFLKVNGDMIFLQGGRLLQGGSNFISLKGRLRGVPGRFKGHFLTQITFFFVLLEIVIC